MGINVNYPFDQASNYTYDSDEIVLSASKAQLKLKNNPNLHFIQDFSSDVDFVYDSDLAEFIGGQVQQKNKRPADAIFYASYESDEDGNWGEGTLTATLGGVANVHDGYLDLSGGNAYVEYPVDNFGTYIHN